MEATYAPMCSASRVRERSEGAAKQSCGTTRTHAAAAARQSPCSSAHGSRRERSVLANSPVVLIRLVWFVSGLPPRRRVSLPNDRLGELAEKHHVALAQRRSLLMSDAAGDVQASIERGQRNADVRPDGCPSRAWAQTEE